MRVDSIRLNNFRNYESCALSFTSGINVFVGANAQGKTNLIEALTYLSFGRSFRIQDEQYLIRRGTQWAMIRASIERSSVNHTLSVRIDRLGKHLQIDGKPCALVSDFIGQLNAVVFSPSDIQFFDATPQKRRRTLDLEIGKLDGSYIKLLSATMSLLKQRNALLKSDIADSQLFATMTEQLIDHEVKVIAYRQRFVRAILPLLNEFYFKLSGIQAKVGLLYDKPVEEDCPDVKKRLTELFSETVERDRVLRSTGIGIQRDDFRFMIDGQPVHSVGSQGQKRMMILAFKLALVEYAYKKSGDYPIICLDDLFSELDEDKRIRVMQLISPDIQCFISTTETDMLPSGTKYQIFYVNDGLIKQSETV